ncbi:MAG: 2-succinylbenzoate--CoA ligase [Chlamydiia bacterium]|nr:2-succinylbenzoate--CoA ligase [Chlamydiia bacterium]
MKQILDLFSHAQDNKIAIESETSKLTYKKLRKMVEEFEVPPTGTKIGLVADLNPNIVMCYFALLLKGKQVVLLNPKEPKEAQEKKLKELGIDCVYFCDKNGRLLFKKIKTEQKPYTEGIATYLFTSGSSGKEKVVALGLENHILSAKGIVDQLDLNEHSRYFITLPLSHVAGLSILYRCFMKGACVVFGNTKDLYFSISKKAITHVSLVSTQLTRLLLDWKTTVPSLKAVLLGGSSTEDVILKKAYHLKLPIYLSYGMSEMSSTITLNKVRSINQIKSSGFTLPYRKLTLTEKGEILVSGKTLFSGYLDKSTGLVAREKEPFNTKDIGSYSEDYGLTIKRRMDSMFISGGENIYPEEIEQHLNLFEGVSYAIVTSISNREYGRIAVAFIKTSNHIEKEPLKEHLRRFLPGYKIPKYFLPWPEGQKIHMKVTKRIRDKFSNLAYESLLKSAINS